MKISHSLLSEGERSESFPIQFEIGHLNVIEQFNFRVNALETFASRHFTGNSCEKRTQTFGDLFYRPRDPCLN
jgi:hypothetical protein